MTQGQQQLIMEVTQSLIALIVIGGAVIAILSGNPHTMDFVAVVTAVIGFYFGRQVPSVGAVSPPSQVAQAAAQTATNAAKTAVTAANTATEAQLSAARTIALNIKSTGELPIAGDSTKGA